MKELKDALEKDDIEDIKKKKDALNETAMALATKVYEQAAKESQANADEAKDSKKDKKEKKSKKAKDDDAIDAEYEEN